MTNNLGYYNYKFINKTDIYNIKYYRHNTPIQCSINILLLNTTSNNVNDHFYEFINPTNYNHYIQSIPHNIIDNINYLSADNSGNTPNPPITPSPAPAPTPNPPITPSPVPPGGGAVIPEKVFMAYVGATNIDSECAKKAVDQGVNVLVIAFFGWSSPDNKLLAFDKDSRMTEEATKPYMQLINDLQDYRKQKKCLILISIGGALAASAMPPVPGGTDWPTNNDDLTSAFIKDFGNLVDGIDFDFEQGGIDAYAKLVEPFITSFKSKYQNKYIFSCAPESVSVLDMSIWPPGSDSTPTWSIPSGGGSAGQVGYDAIINPNNFDLIALQMYDGQLGSCKCYQLDATKGTDCSLKWIAKYYEHFNLKNNMIIGIPVGQWCTNDTFVTTKWPNSSKPTSDDQKAYIKELVSLIGKSARGIMIWEIEWALSCCGGALHCPQFNATANTTPSSFISDVGNLLK